MSFDYYNIYCGIMFGLVGYSAWRYGRAQQSGRHMLLGVALMGYSYLIPHLWATIAVGAGLTLLLFWP